MDSNGYYLENENPFVNLQLSLTFHHKKFHPNLYFDDPSTFLDRLVNRGVRKKASDKYLDEISITTDDLPFEINIFVSLHKLNEFDGLLIEISIKSIYYWKIMRFGKSPDLPHSRVNFINYGSIDFAKKIGTGVGGIEVKPPKPILTSDSYLQIIPKEIQDSLSLFKEEFKNPEIIAFIMMRFDKNPHNDEIFLRINEVLKKHNLIGIRADYRVFNGDVYNNIITYLYGSKFGIAVIDPPSMSSSEVEIDPNIVLEVGLMFGLNKKVCILKDNRIKNQIYPTDIIGKLYKEFDSKNISKDIPNLIDNWIEENQIIAK